jgi:hypothetical protein
MRFEIARVLPIYRRFVRAGETADVFHGFAARGEELLCATRRHKILDLEKEKTASTYESRIVLQNLDIESGKFTGEAEEIMPLGEDPRLIVVRGKAYVLTPSSPTGKLGYALFDIESKKQLAIEFPAGCAVRYGKNWQPFVFAEQLYAVHSFSPFRLIRIDTGTGRAEVVVEQDVGLDLIAPHDRFTHFRGGGTALVLGEEIIGFAHLTMDSGRHMPFRWTYSPRDRRLSLSCEIDVRFLTAEGFGVIDPTSFFTWRGKYYLVLSCSNRDWFYGQTHASYLLELEKHEGDAPSGSMGALLKLGKDGKDITGGGNGESCAEPPATKTYFYRATEMHIANGQPDRRCEVHWKKAQHKAGFVIHGPYVALAAGKYRARLQYASPGLDWQEVGYLDVVANLGSEQIPLAKGFFRGTQKELNITDVDFAVTDGQQEALVETRVVANGVEDLRLTDVTIAKLEG